MELDIETTEKVLGKRDCFIKYSCWKCSKCDAVLSVLQNEFGVRNNKIFYKLIKPKQCVCGNKKLTKLENKYFSWEKTSYPLMVEGGK